ncbi:hypothetical protein [Paeniclostridium hominis]|uniref:hypothetical protein n=1 Tax=Paeniclostridium hominis TaxID=2764329 RepID=UPI0022E0744B|nr:hypothetical protein [Paeniclostridium hominis]
MLHRLGSIFFLLAIITSFLKYFKFINNKLSLKLHFVTGIISAIAMIIYSLVDFVKDNEITILPVGLASILIILSGTNKVRKKYKWLHLISVIGFAGVLAFHIIS